MSDAEVVAQQRRIMHYGVMYDAVCDFVDPSNPDLLSTPEAVASANEAVEKLRGWGVQDRQAAAIMKMALLDVRLEKTPFDRPAADRYGLGLLDARRASGELHPLSILHRAEVADRHLWEQEIFESRYLASQRKASEQRTSRLSDRLHQSTGLTAGIVAAGAMMALLTVRRHHGR